MEKSLRAYLEQYENSLDLKAVDVRELSPLVLAYVGDAVYDLMVREYVLSHGSVQINKMNQRKTALVCAHAQSELMKYLENELGLSEEELSVFKRGRNTRSLTHSKNSSIGEYRRATGFEALVGHLYLRREFERLNEIVSKGVRYLCETMN